MNRKGLGILLVLVLITSLFAGAIGVVAQSSQGNQDQDGEDNVTLSIGQQISLLVSSQRSNVKSEIENTAFSLSLNESENKSKVVQKRLDELQNKVEDLRESRQNLIKEFQRGNITKQEFIARITKLNFRIESTVKSLGQLQVLAQQNPDINVSKIRELANNASELSGPAIAAIARGITGKPGGSVNAKVTKNKSEVGIEVKTPSGRVVENEVVGGPDQNHSVILNESQAIGIVLNRASDGFNWTVERVKLVEGAGFYEVRLVGNESDRDRVLGRVDASSGEMFFFMEKHLPSGGPPEGVPGGDEDGPPEDVPGKGDQKGKNKTSGKIQISVKGNISVGNQVTITAVLNGSPVPNATVKVNGIVVGKTDSNGRIMVTVPDSDEFEVEVEGESAKGEIDIGLDEKEKKEDGDQGNRGKGKGEDNSDDNSNQGKDKNQGQGDNGNKGDRGNRSDQGDNGDRGKDKSDDRGNNDDKGDSNNKGNQGDKGEGKGDEGKGNSDQGEDKGNNGDRGKSDERGSEN